MTSSIDVDDTQRFDFGRHVPNPSMSSMGSDMNLFGYEEDSANTSSVSIPVSIVSEQNTPVMVKRGAKFAGYKDDGMKPSPRDVS